MPAFSGDGAWAHLAACASRDEISPGPTMEHTACVLHNTHSTKLFGNRPVHFYSVLTMQFPTPKNPYSQGSLYEFMFKIHKIRSQKMYKPMAAVSQCSVEESACEPLFASDVNAPLINSLSQKNISSPVLCIICSIYCFVTVY